MGLQNGVLYQSLKKVTGEWHAGHLQWRIYFDYLRFYYDGEVIFCSDQCNDVNEIKNWFYISNQKAFFSTGKYTIKDSKIEIVINTTVGTLKYVGEINNENIILKTSNNESNFSQWDLFTMVN